MELIIIHRKIEFKLKRYFKLFKQADFSDNTFTSVEKTGKATSSYSAPKGFVEGLPIYKVIQEKAPHLLSIILETLANEFDTQSNGWPFKAPLQVWVFNSVK